MTTETETTNAGALSVGVDLSVHADAVGCQGDRGRAARSRR